MRACWAAAREEPPRPWLLRGLGCVFYPRVFCVPIWFGSVFGSRSARAYSVHPLSLLGDAHMRLSPSQPKADTRDREGLNGCESGAAVRLAALTRQLAAKPRAGRTLLRHNPFKARLPGPAATGTAPRAGPPCAATAHTTVYSTSPTNAAVTGSELGSASNALATTEYPQHTSRHASEDVTSPGKYVRAARPAMAVALDPGRDGRSMFTPLTTH